MFSFIEYGNNHGTEQGIIPRFYLQIAELGDMALGKEAFEQKFELFYEKGLPELCNFYDIFKNLIKLIGEYEKGVEDGTYFHQVSQKSMSLDRGKEFEIRNEFKNFIIKGSLCLVGLVKAGFIEEQDFSYENFYMCDTKKFLTRKNEYLKSKNPSFLPLIDLIENANKSFLIDFRLLRGEVEHKLFSLEKWEPQISNNKASVKQPIVYNRLLIDAIEFYYKNILDFIEKSLAYYLGIKASIHTNGFLQLLVDGNCNYSQLRYKYQFSVGGLPTPYTSTLCTYD